MIKLIALFTFLLSFPLFAATLHVRDDDIGVVQRIDEIRITKTVDFSRLIYDFTSSDQGDIVGPYFEGQPVSCIEYQSGVRNGKIEAGNPNVPLFTQPLMPPFGIYNFPHLREGIFGPGAEPGDIYTSKSRSLGCGPGGSNPWSYLFETPVEAFGIELFTECGWVGMDPLGNRHRIHIEMWGSDGTKIGHQDIVGLDNVECAPGPDVGIHINWVSDIPIAGFSTWLEDVPADVWFKVHSGGILSGDRPVPDDPEPLTLEERVKRLEGFHEERIL